jgi:hypothetical protein
MNYSYKPFFQNLYQSQKQKFSFHVESVPEFWEWQSKFRSALFDKLGLDRLKSLEQFIPQGERDAILLEEVREEGYLRRKYVLQTLPEVFMPFYMLIPDHVDANMPSRAMIVIPAHGANKNTVCGVAKTPEEQEKSSKHQENATEENSHSRDMSCFVRIHPDTESVWSR